jgi:hypothetical protein
LLNKTTKMRSIIYYKDKGFLPDAVGLKTKDAAHLECIDEHDKIAEQLNELIDNITGKPEKI